MTRGAGERNSLIFDMRAELFYVYFCECASNQQNLTLHGYSNDYQARNLEVKWTRRY